MQLHTKLSRDIFVFILFFMIWFCLFRFTGSITKGYNIYEDNIYVTIDKMLDSDNEISVSEYLIKVDIAGKFRFRPFWAAHLVFATDMTGADLTLYTFYIICLGIFTSFFIYKFLTIAGYSKIEGIIFGLLILAGSKAIIWSDITDSENIGMFMLSLTLLLLSMSIYQDRANKIFTICFYISLLFTSLCKESFILIIPAIMFLYILLYAKKNSLSFIDTVRQNRLQVIALSSMFIILIAAIFIIVGFNSQTYAGIDIDLFSISVIFEYLKSIIEFYIFYFIIAGILILIIPEAKKSGIMNSIKSGAKTNLGIIALFILITFPQYILYFKTGFADRYLLPFMTGYFFMLIYIHRKISENQFIPLIVKTFYAISIFCFIIFEILFKSVPLLNNFSRNCMETTKLANAIVENSREGSDLLFVMDPVQNYHEVYSMKIFLDSYNLKENYYYDFVKSEYINPVFADTAFYNRCERDAYTDLGNGLIIHNKDNYQIENILIFRSLENKFIEKNRNWFNQDKFKKGRYGGYILYQKK